MGDALSVPFIVSWLSENVRFMGVFVKSKSASADQREEGA